MFNNNVPTPILLKYFPILLKIEYLSDTTIYTDYILHWLNELNKYCTWFKTQVFEPIV